MKNKAKDYMFWVLLSTLMIGTCSILFLVWYPYKPVTIESYTVNREAVCRGGEICHLLSGIKNLPLPVNVSVELLDGEAYDLTHYISNSPVGRMDRRRCFNIPYHVKPGKYRLHWTGSYEVNPFNTVKIRVHSQEFEVR
jgi:hypothetical protein